MQTEVLLGVLFFLFVGQVLGTHLQVKAYRHAVRQTSGGPSGQCWHRFASAQVRPLEHCHHRVQFRRTRFRWAHDAGDDDSQQVSSHGGHRGTDDLRTA